MACKNKLSRLNFLKSLNKLLLVITALSIILTGLVALVLLIQNRFSGADVMPAIKLLINCLIVTLPIGLFVLLVIASILFVNKSSKKSVHIQNLSCLESLTDINVLCIDKGGSLTDGQLEIKKVIPLKAIATEEYIAQWISNVLRATNDDNLIANALSKEYDLELSAAVLSVSTFSGGRQYFGASFKGGKNIVIGSPNHIPVKNEIGILKRCEEYINNGQRVLVLAEGNAQVTEEEYSGELEAVALIILKDHIRNGAFETFKWFKNNGTSIKVISSKDALVTSVVAAEAGIENANKYISLEGMSLDEVKEIASTYVVFGKATPEQKEALINVYKDDNKKVAMMGDDYSEMLAMKSADCAIAVDNSDEEIKKIADVVLTNSSLMPLSTAIKDSNRFINNLQKVTALYFARIIFAFAMILMFTLASVFTWNTSIQFPFAFNHFLLCDLITNGVAAFFLIVEKNEEKIKETFLKGVFNKAIPTSLITVVAASVIFVLYIMQTNKLVNIGMYSFESAVAMSVLTFIILGIAFLYVICSPLNKYRTIVLVSTSTAILIALFVDALTTYLTKKTGVLFQVPYLEMSGPAYMSMAIIIIVSIAIYIFVYKLIQTKKGENIENEN